MDRLRYDRQWDCMHEVLDPPSQTSICLGQTGTISDSDIPWGMTALLNPEGSAAALH